MRIALVTHQFFQRFYTGLERATFNMAAELTRLGRECTVIASAAHSSAAGVRRWSRGPRAPTEAVEEDSTLLSSGNRAALRRALRKERPT
jgi:hypothetical protein